MFHSRLTICLHSYSPFRDAGLSGGLIDGMMDICWGEQLRNHQPDEIEWSLLGALCVFNIDRGLGLFNPTPAERKQIETIQVIHVNHVLT